VADLQAHLFRVTLSVPQPAADQALSLPVWIPGSYMVREFSGQLQRLQARQGRRRMTVRQLDKCSWQVANRADQMLEISYEVYANDPSVRTAMLGHERGFFNATSLCLRVHGQDHQAQVLEIAAAPGHSDWTLATGLTPLKTDRRGFGRYLASDYDELADCPVTFGRLWSGQFKACGVPHRFVVSGAPPHFDGQRTTWSPTSDVVHLIQDTLTALDWDGKTALPLLAKSWTISPDGKTYTFKLRDDVTFCSGKNLQQPMWSTASTGSAK
jgi:predicted metalloprotease with PDZ domain